MLTYGRVDSVVNDWHSLRILFKGQEGLHGSVHMCRVTQDVEEIVSPRQNEPFYKGTRLGGYCRSVFRCDFLMHSKRDKSVYIFWRGNKIETKRCPGRLSC